MRSIARVCSTVLLTSAGLFTSPAPAAATTFTVNTIADGNDGAPGDGACSAASGQCTLRAAVEEANASVGTDVISLPAGEYHLGAANLILSDTAEVRGAGAATTIIEQDTFDRIFRIENTATVTISGVTIRGGTVLGDSGGGVLNLGNLTLLGVAVLDNSSEQAGGGIHSFTGTSSLTIDRSTISGNQASGGNGGGISFGSTGTLTVTNSTISDNDAIQDGGGVYDGATGGTVSITNTTISGNRANENSGGIHVFSTATISSSTITSNRADNDAPAGGGNGGGASVGAGGSLTLHRTIVAGNIDASAGAEAPDCSTGPMSGSSNLIGNNTGCAYTSDPATDKINLDPKLGPLADNGEHTQTHALLPGSPAIDGVTGACDAADQRGVPRPQGAGCDIGAYELALCGGAPVNRLASANVPFAGTSGPDVVLGTNGNDSIDVGSGDDKVCAGEGDDQLTGGDGNDALEGGAGTDRVIAVGNVDFILTPALLIGLGTDSLTGIEQATLTGGAGNNLLDASGFLGSVVLNGGDGQDGLFGGPGNDAMDGGPGIDHVLAEGNVNFVLSNSSLAGEGTDLLVHIETAVIFGGPSGNVIDASASSSIDLFAGGGGGADTILGGSSEFGDFLLGEGGKDVVRGGGGPDLLIGGRGKDKLAGQAGSDFVFGDAGDDRLTGGAGKDRLMGGPGQDFMDGGPGRDVCNGGKQRDRARRCEKIRKL